MTVCIGPAVNRCRRQPGAWAPKHARCRDRRIPLDHQGAQWEEVFESESWIDACFCDRRRATRQWDWVRGSLLQRPWQLRKQAEAIAHQRRVEVRSREDAKAEQILTLLLQLDETVSARMVLNRTVLWPGDEVRRIGKGLLAEIAVASSYLTQPLRKHVRVVPNLVPDAERLAGAGWVDASARTVVQSAIRWAPRNLERHLRGETVPTERGEPIDSYVQARNRLQEQIERDVEAAEGPTPSN